MTALKIPPALVNDLLDTWPVARLATITGPHTPHVVPAVFIRRGDHIFVPVDGKQKRHANLQRLQNIVETPHASLLLDYYAEDWTQLWWLRIDGAADQFEPEGEAADALRNGLVDKYPQYQSTPLTESSLAERPTYLRLAIDKISSWAQCQSTRSIEDSLDALTRRSESH